MRLQPWLLLRPFLHSPSGLHRCSVPGPRCGFRFRVWKLKRLSNIQTLWMSLVCQTRAVRSYKAKASLLNCAQVFEKSDLPSPCSFNLNFSSKAADLGCAALLTESRIPLINYKHDNTIPLKVMKPGVPGTPKYVRQWPSTFKQSPTGCWFTYSWGPAKPSNKRRKACTDNLQINCRPYTDPKQ